jgi:hypothetical protein
LNKSVLGNEVVRIQQSSSLLIQYLILKQKALNSKLKLNGKILLLVLFAGNSLILKNILINIIGIYLSK